LSCDNGPRPPGMSHSFTLRYHFFRYTGALKFPNFFAQDSFSHYVRINRHDQLVISDVFQKTFEGVCIPQHIRTLPGFDRSWT